MDQMVFMGLGVYWFVCLSKIPKILMLDYKLGVRVQVTENTQDCSAAHQCIQSLNQELCKFVFSP